MSVATAPLIERLVQRQALVIVTVLLAVAAMGAVATAWTGDALMTMPPRGSAGYAAMLFVMWWAMMLAMMLPGATPAVLTFAALARRLDKSGAAGLDTAAFASGYVTVWTGFSAAATAVHLGLSRAFGFTGMMALTSTALGGAILVAAGLYQLSPLKSSCLSHCQSPLMYLARHWRKGAAGAFRMGLGHGLFCVGCCTMLMVLLFYGGVMEIVWIGGLAAYVLAEKLIPARSTLKNLTGLLLIGWGSALLWRLAV